jgi:hypothetical protein
LNDFRDLSAIRFRLEYLNITEWNVISNLCE